MQSARQLEVEGRCMGAKNARGIELAFNLEVCAGSCAGICLWQS